MNACACAQESERESRGSWQQRLRSLQLELEASKQEADELRQQMARLTATTHQRAEAEDEERAALLRRRQREERRRQREEEEEEDDACARPPACQLHASLLRTDSGRQASRGSSRKIRSKARPQRGTPTARPSGAAAGPISRRRL